jgi:pimeloyl-ACP methyl ester carboxylesterase
VISELQDEPLRLIALDLLGFGASPKPDIDYTVDDHANAVIKSIESLKQNEASILVGHSMGCLIAIRVARLRPDLVRHLVLYEMPLYSGLPNQKIYKIRLDAYMKFYNWVINYQPSFDQLDIKWAQWLASRIAGFEVNEQTWIPFKRSLENTIVNQKTSEDIKELRLAMDVIYGTMDMFVIRGKTERIFGADSGNISSFNVLSNHVINRKASRLIASRVLASLKRDSRN